MGHGVIVGNSSTRWLNFCVTSMVVLYTAPQPVGLGPVTEPKDYRGLNLCVDEAA